jgi:hypothetical protein
MSVRDAICGALVGLSLTVAAGSAQSPPANEDCQACHAEPSMTRADGTPVVIPADTFADSAHGFFGCIDCHTDLATLAEYPHPDDLAPVACETCHDAPVEQVAASVHVGTTAQGAGAAACASCHHDAHAIRLSSDAVSATHQLNIAATCGTCHGDNAPPAAPSAAPSVAAAFADSIHGQALTGSGLIVAPTCTNCHNSHDIVLADSTESPVHGANVPATCGTCHAGVLGGFAASAHGTALAGGDPRAPHCASCHTAHGITRTEGDRWQLGAVEQCGTCHQEALATYRDTFHGQVTALGFTPVAKCADCHDAHRVFGPSDARSRVHPDNLVATCQTCHPSANENFVQYQPHANANDPDRLPSLYYAHRFMTALFVMVFAFFGAHSALWFVRERTGPRDE